MKTNIIRLGVFVVCLLKKASARELFGLPILRSIPERFQVNGDSRIFGGEEVEPHSVPYQVALYTYTASNRTSFCGGSIISRNFILTAGHCLWKQNRAEIILGAHDLEYPNKNQVIIEVQSTNFILHENFTYTIANDIAVIRLPTPIKFSKEIRSISLPPYSDKTTSFIGVTATVSGWGKTESFSLSQVLLRTEEKIITNDECIYYHGDKVKEYLHICTTGVNGKGPCNGDSGGPLVLNSKQIGIVSFGAPLIVGCFNFGFPSGFTRITEHLEWISTHTDVSILYD